MISSKMLLSTSNLEEHVSDCSIHSLPQNRIADRVEMLQAACTAEESGTSSSKTRLKTNVI
jgi:hypothetical protein